MPEGKRKNALTVPVRTVAGRCGACTGQLALWMGLVWPGLALHRTFGGLGAFEMRQREESSITSGSFTHEAGLFRLSTNLPRCPLVPLPTANTCTT